MTFRIRSSLVLLVSLALLGGSLSSLPVAQAAKATCLGKAATKVGNAEANTITGTPRADVIVGKGGNDVIKGLGGGDRLCGGDGNDRLLGGDGKDILYAGNVKADDFTDGGPKKDTCINDKGFQGCESRFLPDAGKVRPWSPMFIGKHQLTTAQAVEDAKKFPLLSAKQYTYRRHVEAMRMANPKVILLVYMNAMLATPEEAKALPDSWFLRGKNSGERLRSSAYGNYLMNPLKDGWIKNRQERCRFLLADTHEDGCHLDVLGTAPLIPGYVTSCYPDVCKDLPRNPNTGEVWTEAQWLKATSNVAAKIKQAVAPKLVYGNGLRTGKIYFDPRAPSRQLLNGMDGGEPEAWIRLATQPLKRYRTVEEWRKDVNLLVDAGRRGKETLPIVKAWASGTKARKDKWHQFALASWLLGNDGRSYFYFSYKESADPSAKHPWWKIDLGLPLGPYGKKAGVYQRRFTRGRVLVNPTGQRFTVSLGGTYVDLQGRRVRSVTLGPHSGKILKKAG